MIKNQYSLLVKKSNLLLRTHTDDMSQKLQDLNTSTSSSWRLTIYEIRLKNISQSSCRERLPDNLLLSSFLFLLYKYVVIAFWFPMLAIHFAVLLVMFNKAALSSYSFPCANVITLLQVSFILQKCLQLQTSLMQWSSLFFRKLSSKLH